MEKGKNYRAWKVPIIRNLRELDFKGLVKYLVSWGVLAPSAHNMQPWKIKVEVRKKILQVLPDGRFIGIPSDKKGREVGIAVGCFAGVIKVVMENYGEKVDMNYKQLELSQGENVSAVFNFGKTGKGELINGKGMEMIRQRRAYRGEFGDEGGIKPETIRKYVKLATKMGIGLKLVTDPSRKALLANTQSLGDRAVLMYGPFRHELGDYLKASNTTQERVMPASTFMLPDDVGREVEEALEKHGEFPDTFANALATDDLLRTKEAAVIGVISCVSDSPEGWAKAGELFVRMWLDLERQGLGVAVMAALVEADIFNKELKMLMGLLGSEWRPTMVFRVGKPKTVAPHSPRVDPMSLIEWVD